MEKLLGQDISRKQRIQFLKDNADAIEDFGYNKPLTEDEILTLKESLTDTSIQIADIEQKKEEATEQFMTQLKPLKKIQQETIGMLKNKSEYRTEECYKFIDHEAGEVGYYNADGELVYQRGILPSERQKTIFENLDFRQKKTGTEDL